MIRKIADVWSLPLLEEFRKSGPLNSALRLGYGPFWGKFRSRSDAEQFLRSSKRISYNSSDIVHINLEEFREVQLFDWPVMYVLRELIYRGTLHSVIDFGGHVGAKYYAYRRMMNFPPDLKWKVVDVPAVCDEGRKQLKQGDVHLSYHDNFEELESCDALLCSGSLQYSESYLDQILTAMSYCPNTIILNKLAVSEEGFYTLESFGFGRIPHRVVTKDVLANISEMFSYDVTREWEIPSRDFIVRHRTGQNLVRMIGQVWERRAGKEPFKSG